MTNDQYDLTDIAHLRITVYRHIADTGRVPTIREMAKRYRINPDEMRGHFERLQAHHAAFLDTATGEIAMAHPFSATPTPYRVHGERVSWWANCAWDAIAIPATLNIDAKVEMTCGDCGEVLEMEIDRHTGPQAKGLVHFYVPAGQWYEDVGFT